jgi:hypothetical protein
MDDDNVFGCEPSRSTIAETIILENFFHWGYGQMSNAMLSRRAS